MEINFKLPKNNFEKEFNIYNEHCDMYPSLKPILEQVIGSVLYGENEISHIVKNVLEQIHEINDEGWRETHSKYAGR